MKTTLNKIREHSPCKKGWEKLLSNLGKTKADDEVLWLDTILNSNGLEDTLWCLRAVEGSDKETRLFAVWCARRVQHLMEDERSIKALDVAESYANWNATEEELDAAGAATWDAAWAAAAEADSGLCGFRANLAAGAAWAAAWAAAAAAATWAAAAGAATWAAAGAARTAAGAAEAAAQEKELRRIIAADRELNK